MDVSSPSARRMTASRGFTTFPRAFFGRSCRKITSFGTLYAASRSFANALSSLASHVAPGARTTHADHRDLGDPGMLTKDLLDLERAQLVAAALEDIDAGTTEDLERPVLRPCTRDGVAGLEPWCAAARIGHERPFRLLFPPVVTR